METKLQIFLNSKLLQKYLVGDTSLEESKEVEHFIANYPEVAKTYNSLQNNLEIIAKAGAVNVPKHILKEILESLEETNDTKVIQLVQSKKTSWFSIAASAAAVLFAVTSFFLYQKNQNLNEENRVVVEEILEKFSFLDGVDRHHAGHDLRLPCCQQRYSEARPSFEPDHFWLYLVVAAFLGEFRRLRRSVAFG
jgi:hypothetical protein